MRRPLMRRLQSLFVGINKMVLPYAPKCIFIQNVCIIIRLCVAFYFFDISLSSSGRLCAAFKIASSLMSSNGFRGSMTIVCSSV